MYITPEADSETKLELLTCYEGFDYNTRCKPPEYNIMYEAGSQYMHLENLVHVVGNLPLSYASPLQTH